MASCTCALTQRQGRFVRSHLIPQAFTRPETAAGFYQFGSGKRPVRRWTSWYDDALVSDEGERILARLDDWAVHHLRQRKMVWSGWHEAEAGLGELHHSIGESPWGVRKVDGLEPASLRIFFLSLLWRAAATRRPEFEEVHLPASDLEHLRELVCKGESGDIAFYPVLLTQLSTRGPIHNHAPVAQLKPYPRVGQGDGMAEIPIFRFYFDGLIAHFHACSGDDGITRALGNMVVGAGDSLVLTTQTFEHSFQAENFIQVLRESKPRGGPA